MIYGDPTVVAIDWGPQSNRIPNFLYVSSTTGMQLGDTIEIMLDNGEFFRTTISAINPLAAPDTAPKITIAHTLPFKASAGNVVVDLTQSNNVAPVTTSDIV